VIDTEARVVQRVYEMYAVDGLSMGEIARRLNVEGIATRKQSARWERSVVWAMLRNPAYRGAAAFGKTRTVIETDITTNGVRQRRGFGLIDGWEIIEKSPSNGRMVAIKLTISEWLYYAVAAREVLTLNREYFRLDGGLERRLYELARKHCGQQIKWAVGMELLHRKSASTDLLKRFRAAVKRIVLADSLPDYRLKYEPTTDHVTFFSKDPKQSFTNYFRSLNLRSINDQSLGLLATAGSVY
jgi:hypothetical protein